VATSAVTLISNTSYEPDRCHRINGDRKYWPNNKKPRPKGRGSL